MRRGEGEWGRITKDPNTSIERIRARGMGSPSEAVLLHREVVAAHHAYGGRIRAREKANRRVADMLAAVTAERDGLKIVYHVQGVAPEETLKDRDEWAEKCRALSRDVEVMGRLLRMHENPNTPTSSRTALHRARGRLRLMEGSYNVGDRGRQGGEVSVGGEGEEWGRRSHHVVQGHIVQSSPQAPRPGQVEHHEDGVRPVSRARPALVLRRQPRRHRARARGTTT